MTLCLRNYNCNANVCLTVLLITAALVGTVSANPQPNYIAPQISSQESDGKVIPWSEYRQRIKQQSELPKAPPPVYSPTVNPSVRRSDNFRAPPRKFIPYGSSTVTPEPINSLKAVDNANDSTKPITIYLPPFKSTKPQRKSRILSGTRVQNFQSNDNTPLIGETNRIVHQKFQLNKATTASVPQRPIPATNYSTNSMHLTKGAQNTFSSQREEPAPLQPVTENLFYGGNYPKAPIINGVPNGPPRSIPNGPAAAGVPQYSRLAAAPLSRSFNGPVLPSQNLVDSIFAQSQVRHAPPSFEGLIPTSAVEGAASPNGNALQSILSNGATINQLSNLAKNLLSLPSGNQELFSTVTNALAGISKPAKLTSTAVLPGAAAAAASETSVSTDVAVPTNVAGAHPAHTPDTVDLSGFGTAERAILEAALKNGELDRSMLMEISKDKQRAFKQNTDKLMEWIQQNRPSVSQKDSSQSSLIAAEHLPYYGSYCGGFSSQNNSKFNVNGALWAVDNRRFIVSKFHFRPGSMTENITFWAGPKTITEDTISDIFPSDNGFYIRPEPIDFTVFTVKPITVINATIRGTPRVNTSSTMLNAKNESGTVRKARDAFRDIYEKSLNSIDDSNTVHLSVKGGVVTQDESFGKTVTVTATTVQTTAAVNSGSDITTVSPMSSNDLLTGSTETATMSTISTANTPSTPSQLTSEMVPTPLEWYEGFQPLLLTLPDDKWIKTTYWMSLRNHKKKSNVAAVLIPNGPGFKIPAPAQLNPLSANAFHQLTSGTIKLVDVKTIEVTEFSFSANGVPAWFMVGKEFVPNWNGHIVPIFDRSTNAFDCESLRDYRNETVTLRLPGTLTIKDVFWLSVYSPPRLLDLSKIFVPYREVTLPPDLHGIATPRCVLP
uniref:DM13 domain-containing protein n=1 Tax=Steinernema glaseri TaxID=37863 RepID=A0A1I7Y7F6_9BILA